MSWIAYYKDNKHEVTDEQYKALVNDPCAKGFRWVQVEDKPKTAAPNVNNPTKSEGTRAPEIKE